MISPVRKFWIQFLSFNVILIVGILLALKVYTSHGEEIEVPQLVGKSLTEAESILRDLGLEVMVMDSQFSENTNPGAVVASDPAAGLLVKEGRRIYITMNMQELPLVSLPPLNDLSIRKATLDLQNKGFKVGQIIYKLDLAHNFVLTGQRNGITLMPGTPLPLGTKVDLVVGIANLDSLVEVPTLTGLTLDEARIYLAESGLTLGAVNYLDVVGDSNLVLIVRQRPMPGGNKRMVKALDFVDVWLGD
jgi:beta-lactam-binding protein with PASTA domain